MGRKAKKIEEQQGHPLPEADRLLQPHVPPPGYLVINHQDLDKIRGDIANLKFKMERIQALLEHVISIRVKKAKKKEQEDVLSQDPEG